MTPEEKARENIDTLLVQAGWKIQNVKDVNFDYVPFSQQGGTRYPSKICPFLHKRLQGPGIRYQGEPFWVYKVYR